MTLRLDRLRSGEKITNSEGVVSLDFQVKYQKNLEAIETALNSVVDALAAAAAADAAAVVALAAADVAQTAATDATVAVAAVESATALTTSGVSGCTITATDVGANVTIDVTAHTRVYTNAGSVSVNAGSVTGLAYSTLYFIYYDQASRLGGAVTYQVTTTPATAAQSGDRHSIGSVFTPAAAGPPEDGTPNLPSGVV